MIRLINTSNYAGVRVLGDRYDFEELYDALHLIIGDEGERVGFENVRIRTLGVCYDLRHAMMGNREVENVLNGLDRDRMRHLGIVASEYNIYYSFEVLWPELLFVSFSLNESIALYEQEKTVHGWDKTIVAVRNFQAAVSSCLEETLSERKFANLKKYMKPSRFNTYYQYATQYIDRLNLEFIGMDKEKRLDNISIMAKRIAEQDRHYMKAKQQVHEAAEHHGVPTSEIRFDEEYPETIDW